MALAALSTGAAALLVCLLYAPALQAAFLVPKFAALEIGAAAALAAFGVHRAATGRPRWAPPLTVGAWLVLATTAAAWAAAASRPLGAPYALDALARWASLFGLACGASALDAAPRARRLVVDAATTGAAAVAAIGLMQHLELWPLGIPVISTPGSTFGNRNLGAEVMAMSLPLALGAAAASTTGGQRAEPAAFAGVALALELAYLGVTRTRGAWVGAGCGLATTAILLVRTGPARPRWSRRSVAIAAGAVALAALAAIVPGRYNPRDAGDAKRYSGLAEVIEEGFDARSTALRTRLGLWRRTTTMIADYPLLGVGPGNWPVVFPRYAEPGATQDGVLSATLVPRQAHEDWLERAAETGVLGLGALGLLAAGAVKSVRRRLQRVDDAARVATCAAAGSLVALAGLAFASFPLEMPGTLALSGLALGLIAPAPSPRVDAAPAATPRDRGRVAGHAAILAGVILVAFGLLRSEHRVRASRLLADADRTLRRRDVTAESAAEARGALERALVTTPASYPVELRLAQALLREGRASDAAHAARQALGVEPYAPHAWAALAAAELEGGQRAAARRDAAEAIKLLDDFPFALELRARAAEQDGDSSAAADDWRHLKRLAAGPDNDPTARAARHRLQAPR